MLGHNCHHSQYVSKSYTEVSLLWQHIREKGVNERQAFALTLVSVYGISTQQCPQLAPCQRGGIAFTPCQIRRAILMLETTNPPYAWKLRGGPLCVLRFARVR